MYTGAVASTGQWRGQDRGVVMCMTAGTSVRNHDTSRSRGGLVAFDDAAAEVRDYIVAAMQYRLARGIDGWRLDAPRYQGRAWQPIARIIAPCMHGGAGGAEPWLGGRVLNAGRNLD
jgi:glycosidase